MKKNAGTLIALLFVFPLAGFSAVADEFEMQGIVTKIDNQQITIKDVTGAETIVEGKGSGVKAGDIVLLKGQITKSGTMTGLTAQDIDFLAMQCLIDKTDANAISTLKGETSVYLYWLVSKRDCKRLEQFKVTREYLKKFTPPPQKSPFPPKGYNRDFLTAIESNYINETNKSILDRQLNDFFEKKK
jgi:hypothetical protein